jgi:hypothetical protein
MQNIKDTRSPTIARAQSTASSTMCWVSAGQTASAKKINVPIQLRKISSYWTGAIFATRKGVPYEDSASQDIP